MTLISQLLMGLNVELYPPYRTNAFNEAYRSTGYDQPDQGADEAALYEHALGFLDRFIQEAQARGLTLRNRLDAQSMVWLNQSRYSSNKQPEEDNSSETEGTPRIEQTGVDLVTLANELWLDVDFLDNIQTLLEDKLQVIFQGPPARARPTSRRNWRVISPVPMSGSRSSSSTRPTPTRTSYRASVPPS